MSDDGTASSERLPLDSDHTMPFLSAADKNTIRNAFAFSHGNMPSSNPPSIPPSNTWHSRFDSRTNLSDVPYLSHRRKLTIDSLFHGPQRLDRHSKWPLFLRIHGSVMPRMIIPMIWMAFWSTLITCICVWVHNLGISNILLTVMGFVVSLSLSMRMNTAYERYMEGRRSWSELMQASRTVARCIWVHTTEREGEEGKEDVIEKLTGINLILAFAISLKHKLRFEPEVAYDDLYGLVCHLDTFAKAAYDSGYRTVPDESWLNRIGEYLRIPFAISNPRKAIKKTRKPIGNLPLEILNHLSAYIHKLCETEQMKLGVHQNLACTALYTMENSMNAAERVLNTPLPLAYAILITQITWIYVMTLPFQLFPTLRWVTIPASMIATYIIHGLISICAEIENPFGNDVNDLPLDIFCNELETDLDIITSAPPPHSEDIINHPRNMILYPLSTYSAGQWKVRSIHELRAALRAKATVPPASLSRRPSFDTP